MAGFFNKIWSGLDFWDKEENRRQRQRFAREDEEERLRRARELAARRAVVVQGPGGEAVEVRPDPTAAIRKVGSQSQFGQKLFDPNSLLQKAEPPKPTPEQAKKAPLPPPKPNLTIDKLVKINEKNAIKPKAGPPRRSIDRAINTVAASTARVGTGIAQGISGLFDLISPGKGTSRVSKSLDRSAKSIDKFAKEQGNEKLYKVGNVVGEIGSFFIPTQAAARIASAFPKATKITSNVVERAASLGDNADDYNRIRRALAEGARRGLTLDQVIADAAITAKYTGENAAKGRKTSPGTVAADIGLGIAGGAIFPALNKLRKGGDVDLTRDVATQSIAGGGSAANRLRKAATEAETRAGNAAANVTEDAPDIPIVKRPEPIETPKVEVAPGVKSTNIAKVEEEAAQAAENVPRIATQPTQPVPASIPDPANQLALLKADAASKAETPVADFSKAINVPLQKVEPETPVPVAPADVDAQGNPALIPDQQAARELIEEGLAPQPAPSPVAATEQQLAREAARAAAESVTSSQVVRGFDDDLSQFTDYDAWRRSLDSEDWGMMHPEFRDYAKAYFNDPARPTPPPPPPQIAPENVPEQVNTPAPRTRQRAANQISDEELRADVLDNFPQAQRLNLEEAESSAKAKINDLSDDELIRMFTETPLVETPAGFFTAVNSIRRLEQIGTDEAEIAIRNAIDGISEYSARSGRNLRTTQVLFEDMPTALKADYLEKKIANAGVDMTDANRMRLVNFIEAADNATDRLRTLEDEARAMLDSGLINNKNLAPEVRKRAAQLSREIQEATAEKELRAGEAYRFYQEQLPKNPSGKRLADVGRTLMLSAPSGRAFDILSTTATSVDDLVTRGISNLIGKTLNKIPGVGPGTYAETISSPSRLIKGIREGAGRVKESFTGGDHVEDFLGEAKRATRGDIQTGGTFIRRGIRTLVEAPTNLTRGLREEQLFREGMQEAKQQGLKGRAARTYAELRTAVPTKEQLHIAQETHMKANMLHNNRISRVLTGLATQLDKGGGGWGAALIRNQVAPFTSWLGGNLHRTFTDKNVLWNAASIVNRLRKGDTQGAIDSLSKLAVNTGEAYAVGALLTKAGVITTEDANGDSYGGLYIHIGDRYMPVAAAGTVSVPLILGNAIQQSLDAEESGEAGFIETFVNTMPVNILKNAGVASVFGGENNFQSALASAVDDKGNFTDAAAQYVGDFVRQYIPAVSGDINSMLDANRQLNPTGEAALTKITKENPETGREKTDVVATELQRTKAKIPFLSQSLEREEGKPAKDLLDRILHGTRETGEMVAERKTEEKKQDVTEALKERKAKLEDLGYSVDDEGKRDAFDEGDYDWVIQFNEYKMTQEENEGKLTKNERKRYEEDIKKFEIYRDSDYEPDLITGYEKDKSKDGGIGVSAWRDMMESGDAQAVEYAKQLADLDDKLFAAGLIKDLKYNWGNKGRKRGSRGARSGRGRGRKGKGIGTSIAKQSLSNTFSPLKALPANFATPQSAIPQLEKVPNYDKSKLKKITVSRGGRP